MGVLSIVHSWHFLDLRASATSPKEISLLTHKGGETLKVLHVLGEGCGCSEFTAEYLYERGARSDIREIIYFLGSQKDLDFDFKSKGYEIYFKTMEEIKKNRKKINGVPLFQVYSKDHSLLYSGGYSTKMISRGSKFMDLPIIDKLMAKGIAQSNPVFGCLVGKEFANSIDPLGLKY
ncbi:hypothetical protein A9Q84_00365 [Halobacteriovorax marinus]|uniref:Uncharacterized protein n=1 Tax=Halobacteriovorax marinus TaxID=97084 RepID=A0A1Y5FFH9_9BACT|nr:hypothetical protein A9Q84_00365 [Halobacteriovorax marinus]